jgi:hypothetical protein
MALAMELLFLMTDQSGGPRPPRGGAPVVPPARRPTDERDIRQAVPPVRRPGWRERGWDIPWLGGRSTAPWVVLATVLILLTATVGALYAKQRPDRLGWTTETVTVRSDSAVEFTFNVFKAPTAEAACDIVAADRQGGVGTLRDIPIPARTDGVENNEITVSVPTTRRAETAILETCRIVRAG